MRSGLLISGFVHNKIYLLFRSGFALMNVGYHSQMALIEI